MYPFKARLIVRFFVNGKLDEQKVDDKKRVFVIRNKLFYFLSNGYVLFFLYHLLSKVSDLKAKIILTTNTFMDEPFVT